MKKLLAMLLVLTMVMAFAACNETEKPNTDADTTAGDTTVADTTAADTTETPDDVKVMTHEEYMAAEIDAEVVIETYVQNHQSWWDNKITVYCQSPDGAYFVYELACSEEDAAKLVPGTKIRVTGTKGAWAGEVEVMNGTFEFVEGGDTFIAEAIDATDLLGTDDLINHQNEFAKFNGLTVKAIEYKNGEPGDDIYLTLSLGEVDYSFCVEIYLTGEDSDVYTTVATLKEGDVVNVEGFIYWYEGVNPHVTAIAIAE